MKSDLVFCLVVPILAFGVLVSCGRNGDGLRDGSYTAEAADFNVYGWKDYMTICVSGGHIILVEFDAYNPSGFLRSWDTNNMRTMSWVKGTYPNAYTRYYSHLFLDMQGTGGIDVLSGASNSHFIFLNLAEAVLKNAREGNKKIALVQFREPL